MSSMDSFYGGRQGASFVIVKRFDGIDIPENTVYRVGWFAQDIDGYFIVPLVERTGSNYKSYPNWSTIPRDGVTTVTSQGGTISTPLPLEYAEGMVQCFKKGGASTSTVGYGEYVIIDAHDTSSPDNPDNAKIFRRGMDYDNDLGGAEYIGQVIGPQGDSPEVNMATIDEISHESASQVRQYDLTNDSIVPGKYTDGGLIKYNDGITYGWATIKDNNGIVQGALIGFTFPYLVAEMGGNTRLPYYKQGDTIPAGSNIGDRIPDNFDLFVDNGFSTADRDPNHGDTGHPFYRKWKLEVPQGVKGESQTQLILIPSKVKVTSDLWLNKQDLIDGNPADGQANDDNYVVSALDDTIFNDNTLYPYDTSSKIVGVVDSVLGNCYAELHSGIKIQLTYVQTNYDNHQTGDKQRINIGDYNTVKNMWLDNNGVFWVEYTEDSIPDDPINPDNPIPWIDDVNIDTGLNSASLYDFDGEGTGTQKVNIYWNYGNYIVIVPIGTENPSSEGWYEKVGNDYILTTDITVTYGKTYYKFIPHQTVIGQPLNYIMETIVTTYDPDNPNTPQDHLLVLYSDPAYRNWLATKYPSKMFTYTSQKFTEADPLNPGGKRYVVRNDWFDLGYVKGEPGGLHIIGEYVLNSGETYQTYLTDGVPPENMPGNTSQERGWAYLITDPSVTPVERLIYTYDYIVGHDRWTVAGKVGDTDKRLTPLQNGTHLSLVYDGDLYNLYDIIDNKLEIWVGPVQSTQGSRASVFNVKFEDISNDYGQILFCKDKLVSIKSITKTPAASPSATGNVDILYEVKGKDLAALGGDDFYLRIIR